MLGVWLVLLLLASVALSRKIAFPPWHDPHPGGELTQYWMPLAWSTYTYDPMRSLSLPFEEVAFRNRFGRTLRGWWVPGDPAAASASDVRVGVVCVHGGGRDRRAFLRQSVLFHRRGWHTLLFDCTNHGTSDGCKAWPRSRWPGRALTYGTREWADVADAVQFARILLARIDGGNAAEADATSLNAVSSPTTKVVLMGTSQGAVSCILAAAHERLSTPHVDDRERRPASLADAFVAENAFLSPAHLFWHLSGHVAQRIFIGPQRDRRAAAADAQTPLRISLAAAALRPEASRSRPVVQRFRVGGGRSVAYRLSGAVPARQARYHRSVSAFAAAVSIGQAAATAVDIRVGRTHLTLPCRA
eukprot:ctg_915.g446